jgi:hypothetical protein
MRLFARPARPPMRYVWGAVRVDVFVWDFRVSERVWKVV